jgi:hypothetical protein
MKNPSRLSSRLTSWKNSSVLDEVEVLDQRVGPYLRHHRPVGKKEGSGYEIGELQCRPENPGKDSGLSTPPG